MTIISIIIITAFVVIYFITYTNIEKENNRKLESIPRMTAGLNVTDYQEPLTTLQEQKAIVRIPIDYSISFSIWVNNVGQVTDVLSYIDMPREDYFQIAEEVLSLGKNEGKISFNNKKWQYRINTFKKFIIKNNLSHTPFELGNYQITFLDVTDSSKTLTQLLITFVLVGIAMLLIFFGVSLHFANRSIGPIEESWIKQKQFVADASHELKTPLAIINANSDALLANGEETINSQKKWISYIQAEAGRMGRLINDMLYLAKVEDSDAGQLPFDLSDTILNAIASMEVIIFEKGIQLTQTIEPDLRVKGDSEKIKQAVLILLDNAIKYVNDNGSIHIELKQLRSTGVFSVQNSGEGIPQDELPRVFDRFYRSDPSRSQETGGYGLGLSIAKAVIERSEGRIYADSSNNSTTFGFELKLI